MSTKNASDKPVISVFSSDFAKAVETVLATKCKDGRAVKRASVAHALRMGVAGVKPGIANRDLLTLLVGLCVGEGDVKGYDATRGRKGGIYSIAQREALAAAAA